MPDLIEDKKLDWDAVELDYCAGVLPDKTIAEKYGISLTVLQNRARSVGWAKTVLTMEDQANVFEMAENPRFPADSIFTQEDIKVKALMTAGQVVANHRKDVAKLREMTSNITGRLEDYLLNDDPSRLVKVLGGKESPADLLEKLSRILTRVVTLEREAYGLGSLTINNEDGSQEAITKEIRELGERLKLITQQKAQGPDEANRQDNVEACPQPSA